MIALLGSSGFVGTQFQSVLNQYGLAWTAVKSNVVNLQDVVKVTQCLEDINADYVINCAGYTGKPNVDACELHKRECLAGNALLPAVLSEVTHAMNIPWGHVSSGCIFTGRNKDGKGFTERDAPNFSFRQNNCSFYSGTKALGEEVIAGSNNCYVWRLRIPFNNTANPRNYIQKLIAYERLLEAENSLSCLDEFVKACVDCFQLKLPFGTYNLTNPGSVWTSDVCKLISKHKLADKQFQFFRDEVDFMEMAAKTPRSNCVLDSSKATKAGLKLTPVIESLENAMQHWNG